MAKDGEQKSTKNSPSSISVKASEGLPMRNSLEFEFLKFWSATRVTKFNAHKPTSRVVEAHFKEYPRLPQFVLPEPQEVPKASLGTCLEERFSPLRFKASRITTPNLSRLLYFSCGLQRRRSRQTVFGRVYPSAGAKYPIEVYPILLQPKELPMGLYHYHVKSHSLRQLLPGKLTEGLIKATRDIRIKKATCVVVLSSIFARTVEKYGERGFRYVLLEAGHIAQNFALVSTALKIGCLTLGGFADAQITTLLDVNIESELPLYLLVFGGP